MSNHDPISRRSFLGRSIVGLAVLGASSSLLSACGGEEGVDCTNPPGLGADMRTQRTALHYNDHGQDPNRQCQKCQFFQGVAGAMACATCTLNLGAVSPLGTCDSFSART